MKSMIKILVSATKLLMVAATVVLLACAPEVSDQQMIQTARAYLDQNKLREATLELKNALQSNPENAEARYLLGNISLDIGDAASAEKEFRRAAGAGWQEGLARVGQARAMINSKTFQKLIDEIKVKESYPVNTRADLYALRALAQLGLGNASLASETLKKAVEIDANAFHVLTAAVQIYLAKGELKGATDSLQQGLKTYQNNPEILLLSAAIAIKNNDFSGAEKVFKKVIAQDPGKLVTMYGRRARLGLARFHISNKAFDNADKTLMPLLTQMPDDPETNFVTGLLAFERGELDLAKERLLDVLKVVKNHRPTQLLFGTVSYALQDFEQAAYYVAKYVSVMPDDLAARKLLGRTYIKLGRHEEAQALLQSVLEVGGEDAELLALVALSQMQAGDAASGIAGLENAVTAAPENSTLRSVLARAYISAGETELAVNALNTILAEGGNKQQTGSLLISTHIRAQQYDQAIVVVLDMLQGNPQDPAVLSLAGNVFVMSNDRAEARQYFNKALQIKPDYLPATMLLARLEELEGRFGKAETLYKKLASMNKEDIAPLLALARLAEIQKQNEKMIEWLELANKRAAQDVRPRKILSEYYLREQRLEKAGQLIKAAIKIAPRDQALLVLQARWLLADAQYNKALLVLNPLVTREPDSVAIRTMLGEAYLKLDQVNDAQTQLNIVLEKQPYYVPALVLITNLKLQSGHDVTALAFAEKIQKIKPDLYFGFELAGDASMLKKDYLAAQNSYERAFQHKQLAELAIKLSEASTRAGKSEVAAKPLLVWLDDHPDDARVLQFLGSLYQNSKQNNEAIKAYEKALIIQPDNVVALNNLAGLYSLENNPKALELAESAHRLSSNNAGIKDTYGWLLVQQGQAEKGRRLLEQAREALPASAEVKYHYAVALLKLGEEKSARSLLEKLLASGETFEGRDEALQLLN